MDSDVQALIKCCAGIEETSEKMRQATIEFLWDKYVNQPIRDARKKRLKETY